MKSTNEPILRNTQGFSLVEVIASILLLSLILLSFFTLFIQTNKTKQTSNDILDATYLAQYEIEKFYALSKEEPVAKIQNINNLGYLKNGMNTFIKEDAGKNLTYTLTLKPIPSSPNLTGILIIIKEDNKIKAQMETILKWQVNP